MLHSISFQRPKLPPNKKKHKRIFSFVFQLLCDEDINFIVLLDFLCFLCSKSFNVKGKIIIAVTTIFILIIICNESLTFFVATANRGFIRCFNLYNDFFFFVLFLFSLFSFRSNNNCIFFRLPIQ